VQIDHGLRLFVVSRAPKWGIRSRTPLQLVGLEGLDKSHALRAPGRPMQLISPSYRNLWGRLQKVARHGSPVRSMAQMMRAFLLLTATVARLKPRRSSCERRPARPISSTSGSTSFGRLLYSARRCLTFATYNVQSEIFCLKTHFAYIHIKSLGYTWQAVWRESED
jgi:hypothetical protein